MADRPLPLRHVAWREICPWLLVLRSVELAFELRKILLGTCAVVLLLYGWRWTDRLFPAGEPAAACPLESMHGDFLSFLGVYLPALAGIGDRFGLASGGATWAVLARGTLLALWTWLVSAWAGGILLRLVGLQVTADEPSSLRQGCRYVLGNFGSYLAAPLVAAGFAVLLAIPLMLGGMLLRSDWTAGVTALAWLPLMGLGTAIAVLLATLTIGLPWMWAKTSIDRGDGFEGFATAFSFLYQRPLYFAFCIALAIGLGEGSTRLAGAFFGLAERSTLAAVAFGSGPERLKTFVSPAPAAASEAGPSAPGWPAQVLSLTNRGWQVFLAGYAFAFFWTAVGTIFFVLRYDLEAVEMDRAYREPVPNPRPLPPLEPAPERLPVVSITPRPTPAADKPPAGGSADKPASGGGPSLKVVRDDATGPAEEE